PIRTHHYTLSSPTRRSSDLAFGKILRLVKQTRERDPRLRVAGTRLDEFPREAGDALRLRDLPAPAPQQLAGALVGGRTAHRFLPDRKSTRLNFSHAKNSYAV